MDVAIFLVLGLVVLGIGSYVFLMIKFPEWVGITGDSARATMREHQEGAPVNDSDIFSSESKPPGAKD